MQYYFEIEDRFAVLHPIEDPVGWDGTTLVLQRDPEKHGVFPVFQGNTYEYNGAAARMLRDEYETYGIEGNMTLIINVECGAGMQSLIVGRFSFAQWGDEFGDECSVRLPIETTSDVMTFRNRMDQKVNLQTSTGFDGSTFMSTYAALPFTKTLPGKSIFVQDYALNDADTLSNWEGTWVDNAGSEGDPQMAFFVPGFNIEVAEEIGSLDAPVPDTTNPGEMLDVTMPASWVAPPDSWVQLPYWDTSDPTFVPLDKFFPFESIQPVVNYDQTLGRVYGDITLTLDLKYDKTVEGVTVFGTPSTTGIRGRNVYLGILHANSDPELTSSWTWISNSFAAPWAIYNNRTVGIHTPQRSTFTHSVSVTLKPGDRIYYFEKLLYQKKDAFSSANAFYITTHTDSYFKLSGLSVLPDTESKLFMVNEAWSRITEAITNDGLRVYSDFYGRTDSEPYTHVSDGCGSHTAVTMGLFIRRMEQWLATRPPVFSLSINDMWNGLNPIHNIGMGIEADPNRTGFNCLRIESWRHFYGSTVVFSCIGVSRVKRKVKATDHVSIFKFGYSKWEAEEFNGIDEFMTQREYRTELTQVNNTLSKVSQFIASPFAWEVTRRIGNLTTEDWRYDKEPFVVTMKRSGSDLIVQVGDITSANHIVDPDTIINFAIRPTIIGLRWLPMVLASYRQADAFSKIIFTDGDGNVYAQGKRSAGICIVEDGPTSEKEDLSPGDMDVPADGLPIWYLEEITFEFPLTVVEFKQIEANPTGKIYYEGDGVSGYGWIDTLNYKPESGMAEFNLIPAR